MNYMKVVSSKVYLTLILDSENLQERAVSHFDSYIQSLAYWLTVGSWLLE